jgi:crotonobetainyl-CoA:carnitine CoA-transferase CaiB-like acyl-CoA transferase
MSANGPRVDEPPAPRLHGSGPELPGLLSGVAVVEIGDEQAEYCGLLLAGMGATVIKVEPPEGSPSRRMAPFLDDRNDPERSLFFWTYNRGKRSIAVDPARADGRDRLRELVARADVVLESGPAAGHGGAGRAAHGEVAGLAANGGAGRAAHGLVAHGLDADELTAADPGLIVARMTPFGDDGPWAGYRGCDLVHLALGGVTMNCGYDPDPEGRYDLPPIAPQVWHAYHIAGEHLVMGIVAALIARERTGRGQRVSIAVHEAVSKNTELDVTNWVMSRTPLQRQTCRHAANGVSRVPSIAMTKDGRWVIGKWNEDARSYDRLARFLDGYGMAADLFDLPPEENGAGPKLGRTIPGSSWNGSPDMSETQNHRLEVVERFVRSYTYAEFPWREAQESGLMFAPLRLPHENVGDSHWRARQTFAEVEHPEVGRSFTYPASKWLSTATAWSVGHRAPTLDEDADAAEPLPAKRSVPESAEAGPLSARGKPLALDGVRILDFTWFLASAGATRFLTSFGAESIKVEWKGHPDTRFGAQAPIGGRHARDRATAPLEQVPDAELGGQFNFKNAGKRGISLNLRDPRGLEIAKRLVALSDVVAEGFSPGVMDRWGLGYDVLREIRPDIIYAQQSGAGQAGTYESFRAIGPIANAITGLCEMSGIPEPAMPAGWGYSYLDWIGAYSFATAILAALYHRQRTGEGQWIDASQAEAGLYLTGLPILDWSANGRVWSRTGNRSPYQPAAPHGIYPCRGEDRWIAIACFDERDWRALVEVAGLEEDPRFGDLDSRVAQQDALDAVIAAWTATQDPFEAMEALQAKGVPAGVCQNAEDRCDRDPQLAHLDWMVEVTGTRIGRWPIPENPVRLSETPAYVGGRLDRGAPLYGEDNEYVFGELLGMSTREITRLADEDVI